MGGWLYPVPRGTVGVITCLVVVAAILVCSVPTPSQETRKINDDDDIIRINSNLVSVDVTVRDKKGRIVRDLKADDFLVTENGVNQTIEFFDSTLVIGASSESPPAGTELATTPQTLPRNVVAIVLDGQTTESTNLKPVRDGIVSYVKNRITDTDSVALFAIAGGLQLLQPFTQNKEKIISAVEGSVNIAIQSKTAEQRDIGASIENLRDQVAEASTAPITTAAAGSAAAQAMISRRVMQQFLQLRSTLSTQQTRPILAALAALCEGLRPMPGKKTVVMFSQGFVVPESLNWQVKSTIDIANRANVTLYIIDSSGLRGGVPQSGALVPSSALAGISAAVDQESRIRASAGQSIFDISRHEGIDRQQDLLFRLSDSTGGEFIRNTNDFEGGLNRIDDEIRSRYTLAYRSTNQNFDGQFRKVKIEVKRPGMNVVTRSGYYAIPPTQIVPLSPSERKLMAGFATFESNSTLPLSVELHSFRSSENLYIVPLVFDIPPASVRADTRSGKKNLQLDVLALVKRDGDDQVLTRLGGNFSVTLTPQEYESILSDKIFYRQDLELQPGNYTIELMVKDRLSGKATAKRERLVLPEIDSEFSAKNAIFSRHATASIPSLSKTSDVLSIANVQIRPSPSRQFRPTDNLIIFFRLYNAVQPADKGNPNVRVTVSLLREGRLATKPLEFDLREGAEDPVPHLVFAKYVKLTGLPPGKYKAVIESRDLIGQKAVTQESEFEIVK